MAAASPEKKALLDAWRYESEWPKKLEFLQQLVDNGVFPNKYVDEYEQDAGLYPDLEDPMMLPKLMKKAEFQELVQSSVRENLQAIEILSSALKAVQEGRIEELEMILEPLKAQGELREKQVSDVLEEEDIDDVTRMLQEFLRAEDKCRVTEDFELRPVQRFIARFMGPRTPYRGALLYHGVGVGKTCTAITLCESYLEQFPGQQCYIVAPGTIQEEFRRTIFDFSKDTLTMGTGEAGGKPNKHIGCTGDLYLRLTDTKYVANKSLVENKIKKLVNRRYKFFGYTSFANYIEELVKPVSKIADKVERENQKNEILRREFSNRVLVIDEAHNLRDNPLETSEDATDDAAVTDKSDAAAGKKLTPLLKEVLRVADGMTFLLMTATPMYNSYLEIVFLLNLLLLNDKFPEIRVDDVFNRRTGEFTPDGRVLLGYVASNYVSFMRGENPQTFPLRLSPEGRLLRATGPPANLYPKRTPKGEPVPEAERADVTHLPMIACSFGPEGEAAYKELADEVTASAEGLAITNLDNLVQGSNWLFPGDEEPIGRIGQKGFDAIFTKEYRGPNAVFRCDAGNDWLFEDNLGKVSGKAKTLLQRLKKVRGVSFVYSRFVASGALTIALALEANGYTLAGRDYGYLAGGEKAPGGRQCALCEKKETRHGATDGHKFTPAKFVLLTGSEELSPNNKASVDAARALRNRYGEDVKIVLGSQVAGEGLNLKFVREVFVYDSWYHLNKLEQVMGRGIRNCSHSALEPKKRNCTVTLLVTTYLLPANRDFETVDTYSYRLALRKAKQVGIVSRVLKEYALDCTLNYKAVVLTDLAPMPELIDSQGVVRKNVPIKDTPLTSLCDWLDDCTYPCRVSPEEKFGPEEGEEEESWEGSKFAAIPIAARDRSTYDEYAVRMRVNQIRGLIEDRILRADQHFLRVESLVSDLGGIPTPLLYSILAELVTEKTFAIQMGDKRGRIIFRNGFLLFQPEHISDERIPIALRLAHVPVARDAYAKYGAKELELPAAIDEVEMGEEDSEEVWDRVKEWVQTIRTGVAVAETRWEDVPEPVLQGVLALRESAGIAKAQTEKLEMITWLLKMCDTAEKRGLMAEVVLDFFWDEYLSSETKRKIVADGWEDPIVRKVAADFFWDVKGVKAGRLVKSGKTEEELRKETKKESGDPMRLIEYFVRSPANELVEPSVGVRNILIRESGKAEFDSLVREPVKKGKTGYVYGFVMYQPKKNKLVFKKGTPPETGAKVGRGAECSINSQTSYEINLLLRLGTTLREAKGWDLGLNEVEFARRRIQNSVRICTMGDLVLRAMDKVRTGGVRWFYRPLEAVVLGHPIR